MAELIGFVTSSRPSLRFCLGRLELTRDRTIERVTRASAGHGPPLRQPFRRVFAGLLAGFALSVSSCATSPTALDSPTGLVAPSGEILIPPCPASAACLGGFVVGDTIYGISCHGVEPTAVAEETLARGTGEFEEARAIKGIPPHLWLAVRGDLACRPDDGGSLHYEWYLAGGEWTQAEFEEWGQRVADLTLPVAPGTSADPAP